MTESDADLTESDADKTVPLQVHVKELSWDGKHAMDVFSALTTRPIVAEKVSAASIKSWR